MGKYTIMEEGVLNKMLTENGNPVTYFLNFDGKEGVEMNSLLSRPMTLEWTGAIHCIVCGKSIRKTYGQGFCFDCFSTAPEASPCIIHPELCEGHLGKGRDVEWETRNHVRPHVVYLAQTSDVKVGVTSEGNVPTRWIDQGAHRVVVVGRTPNRFEAGRMEVELMQYLTDRTDWRRMLLDDRDDRDEESLLALRDALVSFLPPDLASFGVEEKDVFEFSYPVSRYPISVEAIPLERVRRIEGVLSGIRGQYLYFDESKVINLRKYSGYHIRAGY